MADKALASITEATAIGATDLLYAVIGGNSRRVTIANLFTSPTLTTPALGTPSSGVATNLTGTASGLTAGNVTTNANLTGPITSSGNATSIASQTGTGTKFVVDTSPTLVTPVIGVATGISLALSGVILGTNVFAAAGTGLFNLNATAAPTGATGTGVQLVGTDATVARFEADSFGAIGAFTVRRANGTGASPTALASSDQIGAFNFHGYYVTGGPGYSSVQATVSALATQNWTSTNQGTQILLRTTPNNSTTLTTAITIDQDQSVAMAGRSTIATSLAIGGATIGTNALAVTGTAQFNGAATTAVTDAVTNASTTVSTLQHISSGTPTTTFGVRQNWTLGNSAGTATVAASMRTEWLAATAGSESSAIIWSFQFPGYGLLDRLSISPVGMNWDGGVLVTNHADTSVQMSNSVKIGWPSGGATVTTIVDTNLSRSAAGIIQFGTTAANAAGSWLATNGMLSGTLDTTGPIRGSHGYTVATLPAAGTAGRMAYVTDALTPSFLTIIVGGGFVVTPVFDNGTNWVGG